MVQNVEFILPDTRPPIITITTKNTPPRSRSRTKHYDILPDRYNPVSGERALWVAVITQALMDALTKSNTAEAQYYKHEARHWLTSNSPDFIYVCLLAGFEPDYVRRRAKKALICLTAWRAAAGKGKRYAERKAYRKKQKTLMEK